MELTREAALSGVLAELEAAFGRGVDEHEAVVELLDSLNVIDVVSALQRRFQVRISSAAVAQAVRVSVFSTPGALADWCVSLAAEKAKQPVS
jgi:acyl carrier protein